MFETNIKFVIVRVKENFNYISLLYNQNTTMASYKNENSTLNTLCRITTNTVFDSTPLIVGILTMLKQYHPNNTHELIALLCQYIRSYIHDQGEKFNNDQKSSRSKSSDKYNNMPKQAKNALHFLDLMCKYGAHVDRKDVAQYLPAYMFDSYDSSK